MASKNDLVEIKMRLIGARQVAEESEKASTGIRSVGKGASYTGRESERASRKTSVLTRAYGNLGKAARYGIGFLGVGGVFALKSAVENTEELSKTTSRFNRSLGLSVREGSRWAQLAHARGIADTALNMGMTKLGKSFLEANHKGGTARTGLNELGITQEQTAKGAHNLGYALDVTAAAFGRAHGGPERQTAALSLLGKGSKELIPIFALGRKGMEQQLHWADKFGGTLTNTTNKSLHEMITAQYKNKEAMGALQLTLTQALTPAIAAGDDQLQEFIGTLNDPKLSSEQKIVHIEKQFESLEGSLIKIISAALPKVAENGGKLGLALAGAVWTGFKNSDLAGKLVIGAWLFKFLGGFSLIGTLGAKVGGKLATSLGTKFLETVAPYFAAEAGVEGIGSALGSQMGGLKTLFGSKGKLLGASMGLAAAGVIAWEIHQGLKEHSLGGPFFPQHISSSGFEAEDTYLTSLGYDVLRSSPGKIVAVNPRGQKQIFRLHSGEWETRENGKLTLPHKFGHKSSTQSHHRDTASRGRSSGGTTIHNYIYLDGKQVAESVAHHGEQDAALA